MAPAMRASMRAIVRRFGLCASLHRNVVSARNISTHGALSQQPSPQTNAAEPATTGSALLDPLQHPDYFGIGKILSMRELFDARVHLGHKEGTLNELMKPYLFGSRLGYLVIDLEKTFDHLFRALNFVAHIAYRDGIILFITRHQQTAHMVEETAKACQEFAHARWWRAGLFTNSTAQFGTVTRLPDTVILLSTLDSVFEEHPAVKECNNMLIPTVAIVDTNCDPRLITYPIPGNDDTPSAIQLYCNLFKTAILLGKERRKKDQEEAAKLIATMSGASGETSKTLEST
ncbi:28S ribosomal protein S2, mitochondrial-like isoform X1 [Rhipicephalus sanguineus]|nr:28S ribosomal protein S2, mitochondrial-like isoform X1 [Rhipicephalus sanguineus]